MPIINFFQTIKVKLIAAVSLFILLMIAAVIGDTWLDARKYQVEEVALKLAFIERKLQESDKLETLFFTDDANSEGFYITGKSHNLAERKQVINDLIDALSELERYEMDAVIHASADIQKALLLFDTYESSFDELVELVKKRGFMDFGLEGDFRKEIHKIEYSKYSLDRGKLLTIRRFEKDFIIRKDLRYIAKMEKAVEDFREEIYKEIQSPQDIIEIEDALDLYQQKFSEYVWAEERIGLSGAHEEGLRHKLSIVSKTLESHLLRLNDKIHEDVERIRTNARMGSIAIMIALLIFGVLIALFILRWLGKPIETLSNSIHQVVESNFSRKEDIIILNDRNDEIGMLSKDFSLMLGKVHESLEEVYDQKRNVERKQEQLIDSIRYAQQIQHAILPSDEEMGELLSDHFIIYRPQQVVSGDFYWMNTRRQRGFFAVVDCTGHGVPGAFMSMIGNTLLNKLVIQAKLIDPSAILESLHIEVVAALRQHSKSHKNNDGMDIGLVCWEKQEDGRFQIAFSGAKQSLLYQEIGEELQILKGVKRSIGGTIRKNKHKPFETLMAVVPPNTRLYLHTDGYADQHDCDGKKYGSPRLHGLLASISQLPMHEQRHRLEAELAQHQGEQLQRDDITIVGLEL